MGGVADGGGVVLALCRARSHAKPRPYVKPKAAKPPSTSHGAALLPVATRNPVPGGKIRWAKTTARYKKPIMTQRMRLGTRITAPSAQNPAIVIKTKAISRALLGRIRPFRALSRPARRSVQTGPAPPGSKPSVQSFRHAAAQRVRCQS